MQKIHESSSCIVIEPPKVALVNSSIIIEIQMIKTHDLRIRVKKKLNGIQAYTKWTLNWTRIEKSSAKFKTKIARKSCEIEPRMNQMRENSENCWSAREERSRSETWILPSMSFRRGILVKDGDRGRERAEGREALNQRVNVGVRIVN